MQARNWDLRSLASARAALLTIIFFVVLMISSGLSLPMPDMATCEEAAFFLRYNYYKRPICTAIQDPTARGSICDSQDQLPQHGTTLAASALSVAGRFTQDDDHITSRQRHHCRPSGRSAEAKVRVARYLETGDLVEYRRSLLAEKENVNASTPPQP
jgi:hypothetical protein